VRIVTFNVNGIRAALKRGFREWLDNSGADVVALQEVRCRPKDFPEGAFGSYHAVYDQGELAGRNGVALLVRQPVHKVISWGATGLFVGPNGVVPKDAEDAAQQDTLAAGNGIQNPPPWSDEPDLPGQLQPFGIEGRWIQADLADAPVTVASLYLPKGGLPERLMGTSKAKNEPANSPEKYARKMAFIEGLAQHFETLQARAAATGRQLVVCGDYNIAHANPDLRNWKANQNSEGFLPEERAWFDSVTGSGEAPIAHPLHDVVRELNPDVEGPYSWWSWRGKAFDNDAGWRIDYQLATGGLAQSARSAQVFRAAEYAGRVSDHAAVAVDYDL
jgi:exodeoxyribonuclease-3